MNPRVTLGVADCFRVSASRAKSKSPAAIDATLNEAVATGATLVKPGQQCSGAAIRVGSLIRMGSTGKSYGIHIFNQIPKRDGSVF